MLTASPWTNPLDPLDVTGDGNVTTGDALAIINQLRFATDAQTNSLASLVAPPILGSQVENAELVLHYDTTGERNISGRDALKIINLLGIDDPPIPDADDIPDQAGTFDEFAHALAMTDDYVRGEGELARSVQVNRVGMWALLAPRIDAGTGMLNE